jgi:adenylate cyclase
MQCGAHRPKAVSPETPGRRHVALLPSTSVTKTRYELRLGTDVIELDAYQDGLRGLVMAEVEFDSEAAAYSFTPPSWFGREVTTDKRYRNQSLAMSGMPSPA